MKNHSISSQLCMLMVWSLAILFSYTLTAQTRSNTWLNGAAFTSGADSRSADLDGDGDIDIIVPDNSGYFQMYLNDGTGSFTGIGAIPGIRYADVETTFGDVDNDGDADIVVPYNEYSGIISGKIFINNGHASFTVMSGTYINRTGLYGFITKIVDMNGDGKKDIFYIGIGNHNSAAGVSNELWINTGTTGSPAFAFKTGFPGVVNRHTADIADIDGDGDLDVASGGSSWGVETYINIGDSFVLGNEINEYSSFTSLIDWDHDGDKDILVYDAYNNSGLKLIKNNGGGNFATSGITLFNGTTLGINTSHSSRCILADINNDGLVDAILEDATFPMDHNGTRIIVNTGCSMVLQPYSLGGGYGNGLLAEDFNGDGYKDVFATLYNTDSKLSINDLVQNIPVPFPVVTSTTPGSRQGSGTVTISATANANQTLNWYSAQTGGTLLATGNSFTTPSINATTTYYVSAKNSIGCESERTAVTASLVTCSTPTVITCSSNIELNTGTTNCNTTTTYTSTFGGTPAPTLTYTYAGATSASGSGDGSGGVFNKGITTVTITATNSCGSASCSFTVKVIDANPPTILTKNITVNLDAIGQATITPQDIDNGSSDVCGIASMSLSQSTFTGANLGANTISLSVTDASGNTATANATVTVKDITSPTVITKPLTVSLGSNGSVIITSNDINNGSNDAGGIASITVSPNSFTCANMGNNTVTLTVTDNSGNSSSSTAIVTINGTTPNADGIIYINETNTVNWNNIPSTTNGQTVAIGNTNLFNGNVVSISSKGGNISTNNCDGMGVTGGSVASGCNNTTDFKNKTINKDQSLKMSLTNANNGIYKLVFSSAFTGRVKVTGKRGGNSVVSFTKLMTANDLDTFDFTSSCALKGICVVDEVELSLADNKSGDDHHRWEGCGNGDNHHYGDYKDGEDNDDDDDDNDDYDDERTCASNCGITIKLPILFVKQKESCGLSTASNCGTPEKFGSVVGLTSTLNVTAYAGNATGVNADGNFTTGSPNTSNYAKRVLVGYDSKGKPSAWEVSANCDIRSIRQGKSSNQPQLPLGNNANAYRFTLTGVDANGQYIYGTRKQISNNSVVAIRWRVTEFYQRVWILNYEVVNMNKTESVNAILNTVSNTVDAAIYPNPSADAFNIRINGTSNELVDVMVLDGLGREVIQLTKQSPGNAIILSNEMLPNNGIYFVQVKQGDFVKVIKITKAN